jgi:hypothetical protein
MNGKHERKCSENRLRLLRQVGTYTGAQLLFPLMEDWFLQQPMVSECVMPVMSLSQYKAKKYIQRRTGKHNVHRN